MRSHGVAHQADDDTLGAWLRNPHGRTVVVVAHPDDEVLGCGALLARLNDVRVVHVTDGAPRNGADAARHGFASSQDYAEARASEARAALALAGVSADRVTTLGVPDQEASLYFRAVAAALAAPLAAADAVLTHAFEGGHSDHDAVAFAVHAACEALPRPPRLVEMPFYHAGPDGWVRQRFLPHPAAGAEHALRLDRDAQDLKRRMVAAHRTQGDTLASFDLTVERVRRAPAYDFTRRPPVGDLLYERHGWNLDWPAWVARVREAGG